MCKISLNMSAVRRHQPPYAHTHTNMTHTQHTTKHTRTACNHLWKTSKRNQGRQSLAMVWEGNFFFFGFSLAPRPPFFFFPWTVATSAYHTHTHTRRQCLRKTVTRNRSFGIFPPEKEKKTKHMDKAEVIREIARSDIPKPEISLSQEQVLRAAAALLAFEKQQQKQSQTKGFLLFF